MSVLQGKLGDPSSENSFPKELGLWVSVAGIILGLTMSAVRVEPSADPAMSGSHGISSPPIILSLPSWRPLIMPPKEFVSLVSAARIDGEQKNVSSLETGSQSTVATDSKSPDTKASDKKILSQRVRKAERLYRSIIVRAAHRHQVEPAMVQAIIMAESSFNPKAVSRRGAVGLMQLMPDTAEALGVENVFDPEHNINAGVLYFKKLLKEFEGDVKLALAAYNAGSRKVKEYQGVPPFKTTQTYIKKVFEYYRHYQKLILPDGGQT
jgi:soluble lytic murein transglycosylase-like protein